MNKWVNEWIRKIIIIITIIRSRDGPFDFRWGRVPILIYYNEIYYTYIYSGINGKPKKRWYFKRRTPYAIFEVPCRASSNALTPGWLIARLLNYYLKEWKMDGRIGVKNTDKLTEYAIIRRVSWIIRVRLTDRLQFVITYCGAITTNQHQCKDSIWEARTVYPPEAYSE